MLCKINMSKINIKDLQSSSQDLTHRYKTKHQTRLLNPAERNVYLEARMPATQAVCEKVLSNLEKTDHITSFLDLGCGSGSATYATLKTLPNLQTIHLIDLDSSYSYNFDKPYQFFKQNFQDLNLIQSYDVIIISYALSECDNNLLKQVLLKSWEKTNLYLIIIEPGTTYGYTSFLTTRQYLIDLGAFIVAPCPHELACPLIHPDWCHFKIRLHRSKIHQQIKQGTKSFEDESYTFGIFAKQSTQTKHKRIIKKPIKRSGHILFDLCTSDGLKREIISRKDKQHYLKAKKLIWGDEIY